jgi:hypothetical protein
VNPDVSVSALQYVSRFVVEQAIQNVSRIPDCHADDLGVEGRVLIGENGTTERPRSAVPSILEPDDEHRRSRATIENGTQSFSGSVATATIFGSGGAPPELCRALDDGG